MRLDTVGKTENAERFLYEYVGLSPSYGMALTKQSKPESVGRASLPAIDASAQMFQ